MKSWICAGWAAVLAWGAAASAQTPEEIELYKKMTIFSVGGAVAINNEPYKGFNDGDPNILVVPFYVYNKNNLTLGGPNISYRFWKPLGIQLSAEGRYRFQNYSSDDSPALQGMDDRNGTFEVGMRAGKRMGRLRLRAEAMADVAGQHDGFEANAFASFEVGNGRMISLRPSAGVSFQSENLVNYYYGVRFAEQAFGIQDGEGGVFDRTAYFGEEAIMPFVGAQVRVRLSRRLQLSGQFRSSFLPEEITESPIVGSETRNSAFIGISYAFSGPGVIKGRWF